MTNMAKYLDINIQENFIDKKVDDKKVDDKKIEDNTDINKKWDSVLKQEKKYLQSFRCRETRNATFKNKQAKKKPQEMI